MTGMKKRAQDIKEMFRSDDEDNSSSSDDLGVDYLSHIIKKRGKSRRKSVYSSHTNSCFVCITL